MEALVDRLAMVLPPSPLLVWVLSSVAAYVLGSHVLWLVDRSNLRRLLSSPWLKQGGRFLFFLGIPYLALGGWPRHPFRGLLSLEDMGLVGLNESWPVTRWLEAVGTGLGLGFVALLALILIWTSAVRRLHFAPIPWWEILVDGLYLEVHWAFYRGALAVLGDDVYAGSFAALALVLVEWGLSPFWRQGWRRPLLAAERWLRTALALIIAVVFLLTRNLWICLVVHWLLELAVWRLGRERVRGLDVANAESQC
jgi:hypothetical protein